MSYALKFFTSFVILLCFRFAHADTKPVTVALFNYIPDLNNDSFASLKATLENQFYTDTGYNVSINFTFGLNCYDPILCQQIFEGNQIVEMDTVMLTQTWDWLIPLDMTRLDTNYVMPQALNMSTSANGTYGWPTYACTNVMFSYNADLVEVNGVDELTNFIDHNTANGVIGFGAALNGQWDLRGAYIESFVQSYPQSPVAGAYSLNLDNHAVAYLQQLYSRCEIDNNNPCGDGTFRNSTVLLQRFVNQEVLVTMGYPEVLSQILQMSSSTRPSVIAAALGMDNQYPTLYSDAFFLSKLAPACDDMCMAATYAWLNWANEYTLIARLDLPMAKPRYLQMTNLNNYEDDRVQQYPTYRDYLAIIEESVPLDTFGILNNRKEQFDLLKKAIMQ